MPLNRSRKPSKLSGKIAIVTGGGKGIGKALAIALCKYGATVVIADLCKEDASYVARHIDGIGFECDVTQEREIKNLVSKIKKNFGLIFLIIILLLTESLIWPVGYITDK